jgi:hypothetical protein
MGLMAGLLGSSRWAIFSLVVFFIGGALLLKRVDIAQGIAVANEENGQTAPVA